MKEVVKRKVLVSFMTSPPLVIIYLLMYPDDDLKIWERNLFETIYSAFTLVVTLSFYMTVLFLMIGVPFSLLIDRLVRSVKRPVRWSFALHVLAGSLTILTVMGWNLYPDILDEGVFLRVFAFCVFPAGSFYMCEYILRLREIIRRQEN
ncbi:hypothetical protein [Exiguobacterium sp. S22-S28]|uniref:hypothetical protein n=1 Tax=Exiguobacterium sp. S22-S28 TaxID=3342768 RepID=UPI00372D60FF